MRSHATHAVLWLGAALFAGGAPLASGSARAQQRDHDRVRFDLHLDLGWYRNGGLGFRADIPIVSRGAVDGVDDDLSVSVGAEAFWWWDASNLGVFPVVALQWNFYLSEHWSLCPELGVALWFGPHRNRYWRTFVAPFAGFGARYHFSARNALLLRLTWPTGLQVGITF
ncbi:MAG: hypothetical protein NZ898_00085 [Myxococcota bacterium]|nr:hypothetical protein [Myxococcota bacterium]MDW8361682.1 hypothetical protein [Myxococcales bacterium]